MSSRPFPALSTSPSRELAPTAIHPEPDVVPESIEGSKGRRPRPVAFGIPPAIYPEPVEGPSHTLRGSG